MVEQAMAFDYDGLGLSDLNGLYGIVKGWQSVTSPSHFVASVQGKKNFRYFIGAEVDLVDFNNLVLMPMNKEGYTHLCEILTLGKRQAPKGFSKLCWNDVRLKAQDCLVFLMPPWTDAIYQQAAQAFGDRLYLPVWKDLTWESLEFYKKALELEATHEAQLFATQRPLMHTRDRKPLLDVLTCLLHKTTLEEAKTKLLQNGERTLRPLDELYQLWPERPDLLEKTLQIADRVTFTLAEIRYRYPRGWLPQGQTATEHLAELTEQGLARRYPMGVPPAVRQQTERELKLICKMEYEDYFLTLYEVCQFAVEKKILHQGRGSAANSVVCYALGITAVDPHKVKLMFERFISEERNEPPDIDVDFEHERREEVLQHIYAKYGEGHAAMVCNVIRYRSRMSFRETAKVFGLPLKSINAAIKYMGRDGLRRLMEDSEARRRLGIPEEQWGFILQIATQLSGFPRHLGIHSGGFVITQDPITETVPVEKATMNGRYVIQWNKDDVNTLGLMKLDLLSLGMLSCLRKCFDLVEQFKDLSLTLATLPVEDPATFQMMEKADTVGVFQIESRAQMVTLPRMKPRTYYDLVVQVALIRPGPLQGGMVHPYLRRRNGQEPVTYAHPDLIPVLERTLGVPLFQEQVMQISVEVGGFSPGEADELRRLMSSAWRRKGVMEGVRDRIMSGLAAKGISPEYSEQVFQGIVGFSNYGFPESHAASFALLTYASSYLKCHHPEAFACALLNSQPMGFYSPRVIVADAQRHGVEVLDVHINRSDWDSTLESTTGGKHAVRLGFRLLGSFKKSWAQQLLAARDGKPFTSLEDLIRRSALPKAALLKLAAAGALKDFGRSPRDLLWSLEATELSPQSLLYGRARLSFDEEEVPHGAVPQESPWEGLWREYGIKGLSTSDHPMGILRPDLQARNQQLRTQKHVLYFDSHEIQNCRDRQKVRVTGLIGITQRPPTAKGFCFITLEDEFGCFNIVVPPDIYQRDRLLIYTQSILEVHGELERTQGVLNIKAQRLAPLLGNSSLLHLRQEI